MVAHLVFSVLSNCKVPKHATSRITPVSLWMLSHNIISKREPPRVVDKTDCFDKE